MLSLFCAVGQFPYKAHSEAAAHLIPATRQTIPKLPLRKMRGIRNIVAHDYGNVDLKIVWEVATAHVPDICALLEKFFTSQN
ncbi:MAG: HepT-like ribonuclease domain-containing protein [Candidatus Binatia bacterium]